MDTLSHTLWGGGLFGYRGHFWIAIIFGAFPDLVSFALLHIINFISNGFVAELPSFASLPAWLFINYSISHSLLVAAGVITLVAFWRKDIAYAMLSWPFHILLDAPFHTAEFFPTKFFWPVSDFFIAGIPWSNPWVWYANVAGLVVLYIMRGRARVHNNSVN